MGQGLPDILLNPNMRDYSLDEIEIEYLKEAKHALIKKYYNIVFKSLWNATKNNLKRRIEIYGANEFLDKLDENEKNMYYRSSNTISQKLLLLNNLITIKNCLKLGIINEKTYTILNLFYWLSKNSNESLTYLDTISVSTLLEENLFKIKIDYKASNFNKPTHLTENKEKRKNISYKRRKDDVSYINNNSKKIKKEDILFMQNHNEMKRRKDDVSHIDKLPRRRKDDLINENLTPRRREDDLPIEENPFLQRRRRKDDYISPKTIPNPRRRRKDD